MSSMNRNNGSRASGKKKFGKNLSKVTKAPAPPVPSSANARGATSRNGLLLLSTKRATSSNNNNAGGLLSSKTVPSSPPKKAPPLTLTTESSYTSAHDALLGAVIGASRMTDTQQPPDAWGISEKQTSTEQKSDGVVEEKEASNKTETTTSPETKSDEKEAIINRNAQEEARFQEQRERAAERLRQLEEKMSKSKAPVPVIVTQRPDANADASPLDHWNNGATPPPVARPRTRTLFDPNAPDGTSLAGQSNTEKETRVESSPTMMDQEYSRKDSNNRISHRGDDNEETAPTTTTTQPVIHISNYETRDRGERDKNAGPRMLFDPKSGSMVAADEGGRSKKGKPKGRKDRPRQDENGDLDNGGRLKRRGRGRDKKSDDGSTKDGSKKRSGKIQREPDRLPRTCGVLYKRDELGNCVCVDGCESGDLGYGAHSVPGGRVRNPDEYEKFVAQQKAYEQEGGNGLAYGLEGYGSAQAYYTEEQAGYMAATKEPEMKQKEIDWVKPDEKIELVTGEEDSPTLQATAHSFFPSQAALAAAAAAKEEDGVSPTPMMTGEEAEYSDEEEDDDDDHPVSIPLISTAYVSLDYPCI